MFNDIEIKIPFYDLDPMQVVWHGNYIKYMEQSRCALLTKINMNYDDMEKQGFCFPIVTLNVKYVKPCTFGQNIIIRSTLVPSDNFLIIKYDIIDKTTKQLYCRAETKQMAVSIKTGESLFEIPEPFLSIIHNIQ